MKRIITFDFRIQRAVGWCETVEKADGTALRAAAPNSDRYCIGRVDADGTPTVIQGRI